MENEGVYLDNGGAAVAPKWMLKRMMNELLDSQMGNPHSRNPISVSTAHLVQQSRERVLKHFNTSPDEYSVVFTSGATGALRLVAESFDFGPQTASKATDHRTTDDRGYQLDGDTDYTDLSTRSSFAYLKDNHTSVTGMRGLISALNPDVNIYSVSSPDFVENILIPSVQVKRTNQDENGYRSLFVFPAQSNFSGQKYGLQWVHGFQQNPRWSVCLDAASFCSTSHLDLSTIKPDFVTVSFYKIFGYPTGIGALLIKKPSDPLLLSLNKRYFGGGTVTASLSDRNFQSFREDVSERFEDGTIDFYGIAALRHGFDAMETLGGMQGIQTETWTLAKVTYNALKRFTYLQSSTNGNPLVRFYLQNQQEFGGTDVQGPILNFNLLKEDGSFIGFSQVEKMAELYSIYLRTGCFCNQGACQLFLGLTDEEIIDNFNEGKVCGDRMDLNERGEPIGSVRISFGWTSTLRDVRSFVSMIYDCFVRPYNPGARSLSEFLTEIDQDYQTLNKNSGMTERSPKNDFHFVHPSFDEYKPTAAVIPIIPATAVPLLATDEQPAKPRLIQAFYYPIKSGRGIPVRSDWPLCNTGLLYDRCWMIIDRNGLTLTQKRNPNLCRIRPELNINVTDSGGKDTAVLTLSAEGFLDDSKEDMIQIPYQSDSVVHQPADGDNKKDCFAKVCADKVSALDCGDEAAEWVSSVIGVKGARLVQQTPQIRRISATDVDKKAEVSLANEAQYLLLNKSSIQLLQTPLRDQLTLDQILLRFRANFIVNGLGALVEDGWKRVWIGRNLFKVVGKCSRCQMVCIDQETGAKNPAVLNALRDIKGEMNFGVYLQFVDDPTTSSLSTKSVSIGDELTVLEEG